MSAQPNIIAFAPEKPGDRTLKAETALTLVRV